MKNLIFINNSTLTFVEISKLLKGYKGQFNVFNNFKHKINNLLQKNIFDLRSNNTYIQLFSKCCFNDSFIQKLNSNNKINHIGNKIIVLQNIDKDMLQLHITKDDITFEEGAEIDIVNKTEPINDGYLEDILGCEFNNLVTVLFIYKKVSFIDKVIPNLINSVNSGELIIYNYLDLDISTYLSGDKNTIKVNNIANIKNIYIHMNAIKQAFLSNESIGKLLFLDNNIYFKSYIDLINILDNDFYPATTHYLEIMGTKFNNLWREKTENGYYRSSYDNISEMDYKGVYLNYVMFFNLELIRPILNEKGLYNGVNNKNVNDDDFDIVISNFLTNNNLDILCKNTADIGNIIGDSKYVNDKWQNIKDIESNMRCWLEEYVDINCLHVLFNKMKPEYNEPIPWLFEIKFVTDKFCNEVVKIVKESNAWSDGKNNDSRLQGGYEPVPTVDVHLNQIGLREMWDIMLKKVIAPICERFFIGYNTKGTNICFVVKYSMDGQKDLRPHHDSSSYTINIALNNSDEYSGGGTHFLNPDYKVIGLEAGKMLVHPGRCTHYHEGLPISSGERYILIGFIE